MSGKNVLLFAGTTEGRELAAFLDRQGVQAHVCAATAYGRQLLEELHTRHILHAGRLDSAGMEALIRCENISITIDATHPYAREATENIHAACMRTGCRYVRLARAQAKGQSETEKDAAGDASLKETQEGSRVSHCVTVESVEAAAAYLAKRPGNILVTTGAKELEAYTAIDGYRERVFARVLSVPESVERAAALGFSGRNLICMQGPFSAELNEAMLRETEARWLVTKESGRAGGFPEKCIAAERTGATLVVVRRPEENTEQKSEEEPEERPEEKPEQFGRYTPLQVRRLLAQALELKVRQTVTLAGIGMGGAAGFTKEVLDAIRGADVRIGAARMLQAARAAVPEGERTEVAEYRAEQIAQWLQDHPEAERVVILLSGDSSFYSGAKQLAKVLGGDTPNQEEGCSSGTQTEKSVPGNTESSFGREEQQRIVRVLPGISSVSYLSAKLQVSREEAAVVSIHGRSQNAVAAVRTNRRTFVLAGREASFRDLLHDLNRFGLGTVRVRAGAALSYPEERIVCGSAADFPKEPLGDLVTALIDNPVPQTVVTHGVEDGAFLRRTSIPMTRMEVRTLSLSKLQLARDSVVWDIGAGTGSVSVECALQAPEGQVYAVECREEAAQLIEQNCLHFCTANVQVVRGSAPQVLEGLPAPTHVFIGGTNGALRAILEAVLQANPRVRIVLNAIALETLSEALTCLRELPFTEPDITSLTCARARKAASLHMMMGGNPVYVIAAEGRMQQEG